MILARGKASHVMNLSPSLASISDYGATSGLHYSQIWGYATSRSMKMIKADGGLPEDLHNGLRRYITCSLQ